MTYKAYVVYRGRVPGIYATWQDCSIQVTGYRGNLYKGFASVAEAHASYNEWVRSEVVEYNDEASSSSAAEVKNKNYEARNLFEDTKNHYHARAGAAQANSDQWALTRDLINALLVVFFIIIVVILFKLVAF